MTDPSAELIIEPELDKAVRIYVDFMEEIKARFAVIAAIVQDLRTKPPEERTYLQAELAFLQFRLICELVALASLAAHQPYGMADRLMESWNARLALRELSKLNPECFPRPIRFAQGHVPGSNFHLEVDEAGALSFRGFVRYYMKCGRYLHRGVVKHAFEGTARVYDMDALDRWAKRLGALLSNHTVMILNEGIVLMVYMHAGENGSVAVAIGKADGPSVYVKPEAPKRSGRRGKKQSPPE